MSTIATYRAMVPAHAAVSDDLVDTWLAAAAQAHTASRWGAVYGPAMVMWAAAHIEPFVVAGDAGNRDAECENPMPAVAVVLGATPAKVVVPAVHDTTYWAIYLDYRASRAATKPRHIPTWL